MLRKMKRGREVEGKRDRRKEKERWEVREKR